MTPGEGRRFAFTLAVAFAVLAAFVWWRGEPRLAAVFGVVAAILALAGLVIPGRLGPVYRAWMGFALVLSKLTTPIFLGIVYYFALTPTGVLRRTIGSNPLRRSRDGVSCWVDRKDSPRGDLERQF
ncbi:MAG TPA: SxtJ family membrane protein [Gemmatimonadota bacterium]|nr:SxtJ family membrane protein [Gemmatimonadota bacterium]